MKITNEQELIENGYTYIERTYDTGTVEKIMKVEPVISEPAPTVYQPTNTELAQMISDLQADLMIAGVI